MSEQISYNLSYDSRHQDSRDLIMSLNISFENPTEDQLRTKLNTWLSAIGLNLEVISKSTKTINNVEYLAEYTDK
jgi:hypothetical protein